MHEMVEKLLEQLRGLSRFRWIALIAAWSVCIAGWIGVLFLADTYEASARVFVDTRTTLSQVTQGIAVEPNVESQIQRVRQALLGGPQLEKVAEEAGLINAGSSPQQRQGLLSRLRERIKITGSVSSDSASQGLYVISYQDGSRDRSLRVVDRLLNNFVESTLGGKREGSATAQRFLTDQISDYEKRLGAAEARLADFKKHNVGLMPGAQGDYFTRLQSEMESLNKSQATLAVAAQRRDELARQLRGEQPALAATAAGVTGSSTGSLAANDTAARIREAQTRLDELLLRFTEKHPDVIALRETLADLHARQNAEIAAMKRGDPGAAARLGLSANPVYQSIQLQLNQADVELAALRAEVADHQRKIGELRKLVDTAPEVEAGFARLNRDYDVTRAQYQALVERLDRVRLAEEAEQTGIVRFEVIDPPTASFSPVAPNRPQLIIMVLVGGLAVGIGLAYVLQQLKPIFSSSRQLSAVTGLPVLGVVSMTWLDRHTLLERKNLLVYAGAAALLLLLSMVMLGTQSAATHLVQNLTR